MDKNTLLAVVLSVLVITVGMALQSYLFPPGAPVTEPVEQSEFQQPDRPDSSSFAVEKAGVFEAVEEEGLEYQEYVIETDLYTATFSNRGGDLVSLRLNSHMDLDETLEMIERGDSESRAFSIAFGGSDAPVVDALFSATMLNSNTIEFSRTFAAPSTGIPFRLRKIYTFASGEYMIGLEIIIENSVNDYPKLDSDGFAYSLGTGPQIGPKFTKLDGRTEYRHFYTFNGEKRKQVNLKKADFLTYNDRVNWTAIVGKYFALAAITDATPYSVTFSEMSVPGIDTVSSMVFSRPVIKSSKNSDIFRFYIGPKTPKDLQIFDSADSNSYRLSNARLDELIDHGRVWGWLENILKAILEFFYGLMPNYGIAIILLTILTKVILFPFTHKSHESTSKMASLGPKIEEIKTKYKDNPNKMNASMAELYKKEGVNPLGGCLPMLLQIPIFIALYGLLNKHFDLRGAIFIPGWITDLSSPESIFRLPFTIPLLGWQDIRLLPIIYVVTQMLYSKQMSSGNTAANSQMQMMTKFMPLMFFFILYNMPSGLILYWTVSNLLSSVQQMYINKFVKKKT